MRRMRPSGDAAFAAGAMLLALAAAAVFLKLWDADLGVPFASGGDTTLHLVLIKGALENAWHFENPQLGAPAGLELYDHPAVNMETLNLLLLRTFGLGTGDPALAMNLFFLLTFPLTALTAFLVLRRLPVPREAALVVALLYTLLPYHFLRGETHLFIAAYYAVPVGAYLVFAVYRGDRLFDGPRSIVITAALCVLVGTASGLGYYAVFTVLLVAVAAVLRFLVHRERAALAVGGGVVALITAVALLQVAPTIVYRLANGANEQGVAKRFWFESENYSLRLTNLLLPVDGHRVGPIARLKEEYVAEIPQTEARAATLGVVATLGFVWLVGVALAACAGAGGRFSLGLHGGLAALTLAAVLIATTGGFSTFLAVLWPQIRAWNRLSVFIAFFALAAVALGLGALRRRLGRAAYAALLGAVLVIGVLDQTTDLYVPPYGALAAEWRKQEAFFASVEQQVPRGAMVVQLPYEPFPEPTNALRGGYEPALAYLHSDDLRWSYGAMRGRPEDWAAENATKPPPELVPAARSAGFAAIVVDRLGYADGGAQIEAELAAMLGPTVVTGAANRYALYRL